MSHSLGEFFEYAADAIFIAEKATGIIMDANRAASRLLQLPHEKIIGMHQSQLHSQSESKIFNKHLKELDEVDSTVPLESTVICSDGSEIPVEILVSQMDVVGKQCIMGVFRDISIQQNLLQKNEDNAFLTSFSYKLADSSFRDIIKDITLPCIKKHTNAVYAHFAAYDTKQKALVVKHIEADNAFLNTIFKTVGKKIFSTLYPVSEEDYQLIMSSEIKVLHSMTELSFGGIPKKIDEAVRKVTGFSNLYGIPQIDSGNLYGVTVLAFKKHQSLPSIDLLKSYSNILSVSLRKNIIEQTLIQSEERFRMVTESAGEWIWEVDAQGVYTYVSALSESILGYKPSEIVGKKHFYDFFAPEIKEELKNAAFELFEKKEAFKKFENPNVHKDGHIVILETSVFPILDDNGNLIGYRGAEIDITERKLAEQELDAAKEKVEESELQLAYSQRVARIGHFVFDIKADSWSSSNMLDELWGIDNNYKRDVEGWLNLVHPGYRTEMFDYLTNSVLKEHKEFNKEYMVLNIKTNASLWVHGRGSLEFDESGNPIKMFGTIQDITEKKENELELKEQAIFVEQNPAPVLCTTNEGIIISHNKSASKISKQIRVGHSFDAILKNFSNLIINENKQFQFEIFLGKQTFLFTAKKDIDTQRVYIYGSDITERKEAEQALFENQHRFEKSQALGHVGNWDYNLESTLFWVSDESKRIYGFNLDSNNFSTEQVENCIPERERVHQALIDLIAHDKKYDLEFEIIPADKTPRKIIHSIAELERDASNNPLRVRGVIIDITDRKKAEQALKESEAIFREMTDMLPQVVFEMDMLGNLTYVNKQGYELSGYSEQDLIGKSILCFFIPTEGH